MSEWKESKLGNHADIYSGFAFSSNEMTDDDSGYPIIKIAQIQNKQVLKNVEQYLPIEKFQTKLKRYLLRKSDTLIAMTGAGSVGKIGKMQTVNRDFLINQRVAIVRSKSEQLNDTYLYYFLSQVYIENSLYDIGLGAGQPNISPADIGRIDIFLPPLPEQNHIATILNAYDELIENNNLRIAMLEQMAEQIYKEWFVRLRFPGCENTEFEKGVPKGWGNIYFRDFIKLNRGFDLPDEKIVEGQYPVVASTSVKAFHNQYKVEAPCVVTGRSGSLGTVQYVNKKSWPLNTSLYVKDFKGNSPQFVYYFLKSIKLESFNCGAGVPTLNQNHLHTLKLILPSKTIQNKFDDLIIPIFNEIENLQQQTQNLKQTRDLLLPRLISGKLRVKETEMEL